MKFLTTTLLLSSLTFTQLANAKGHYRDRNPMDTYKLTITNASSMPISPALVYASSSHSNELYIGKKASDGFAKICQSGDVSLRVQELSNKKDILAVNQAKGLLFPGQTTSIELTIPSRKLNSFHLEAMYGKTVETCAVINISEQQLKLFKKGMITSVQGQDKVLDAGVRALPNAQDILMECDSENDAISCLRKVSGEEISFIRPYVRPLPSVLNELESRYGSTDVLSTLAPIQGGIHYVLTKN